MANHAAHVQGRRHIFFLTFAMVESEERRKEGKNKENKRYPLYAIFASQKNKRKKKKKEKVSLFQIGGKQITHEMKKLTVLWID